LVVLIYVALDFSLPEMPGAFEFDPAGSVDSIETARGRLPFEVVVQPPPPRDAPLLSRQARIDTRHRLPPSTEVAPRWRAVVNWLPRATAASPPPSEDPH
jgi:hypothetical protein